MKGRRQDGQKVFHHPDAGTITLSYQSLLIEGSVGQRLGVFTAEPGTADHAAIVQLDQVADPRAQQPAVKPTN